MPCSPALHIASTPILQTSLSVLQSPPQSKASCAPWIACPPLLPSVGCGDFSAMTFLPRPS